MKKRLLSLICFIALTVAIFSFTACKDKEHFTVTDSVFSSFTAEDYDGNIIDQTVLKECKVTMINVWGTFCEPCKKELPELAELNAEYTDFQIIGIPVDNTLGSAKNAKKMIAELGADFRHLKVSNSLKQFVSDLKSVPYTIFVNADGGQIGGGYYGSKSKSEWKEIIESILESILEYAGK